MDQTVRAVALRSGDAELIEEVRAVLAVADLPLVIHPPGASPPRATLLLDSAVEAQADDVPWVAPGQRAVWVGCAPVATPDGGRCLALPAQAEELLTRARTACQPRRARVVGVVGARGGAGATSLAAVLARACAKESLAVALVDLDGAGPGLDLTLGIEHEGGLRWADLDGAEGTVPDRALEEALPSWCGVHVLSADWRGGPAGSLALGAVDALAVGHDVVVLDLPRVHAHWAMHCTVVLIVTTCDVVGAEAVRATRSAWEGVETRLVVRGPAPGGLTPEEIAEAAGLPLAVTMRSERGLGAGVERGVAPGDNRRGALIRGARRLVTDLGLAS
ncbi:septum site-determining protein Ssd [Ruania albidiflava]|uniref:septum site-determining protein Ssd n=1 Tax=Ruania albidiflava TaxID=366586 RepID=UPI0003B46BE2|nr:septum site-determining protein Ssd [Ruania albidiflava]